MLQDCRMVLESNEFQDIIADKQVQLQWTPDI